MDYETGKKFEQQEAMLEYIYNILDKKGLIPPEDKKKLEDKK